MTLGPLMIDVVGESLQAEELQQLRDPRVGGVILFARNYREPDQLRELVAEIHSVRSPALLVAVDQEGGRVQRFRDGFTRLPPSRWLGRQYDIDPESARAVARECGWVMAAELRELGVDFSFAPVLDLDWSVSEIIGDRAFHPRPQVVAELTLAYALGMRAAGMAAVAKHFPGHGAVRPDSHVELPVDGREYAELLDDMRPYETLIAEGLQGVMMAHVQYPNIDARIASLSEYWIRTELRGRLGFGGVVFSDDLTMHAMDDIGDMADRVRLALDAGSDMALICNDPDSVGIVLDCLHDIESPASQARLVAMRPQAGDWQPGGLQQSDRWRQAVASLAEADQVPPLTLDG